MVNEHKGGSIGTDGRPLIIHIRMKITNTAFVHHIQSETKEGARCYSSEHLCWEMRRQMFAFSAFLFQWIYPQNIVAGKAKSRANNFNDVSLFCQEGQISEYFQILCWLVMSHYLENPLHPIAGYHSVKLVCTKNLPAIVKVANRCYGCWILYGRCWFVF